MITEPTYKQDNLLEPIIGPDAPNRPIASTPMVIRMIRLYFSTLGWLFPTKLAKQALRLFSKPRSRFRTNKFQDLVSKAKKFQIISDGNRIDGMVWENQGPSVLLVHGWETGGLHLGHFIEPLHSAGYQVITFDGPAHGTSEGELTNLLDFAKVIAEIHHKIGGIDHIVAHSFGGFSSAYCLATKMIPTKLSSLTLVSAPNKLTNAIQDFARMLSIPEPVVNQMYEQIRADFQVEPLEIESAKLGRSMEVSQVLVVHDRKDQVSPFHYGLEIVHGLPNAQLLETENLGHNRLLKNDQVISRIVQFIELNSLEDY